MKYPQVVCVSVFLMLGGCSLVPNGSTIDRAAAQKVADSFMADLVADKVDGALDKMEPEFIHQTGRPQAAAGVRNLFAYCGRPLDSEFKHDEVGFKVYLDGRRKPMRKFYYSATTTTHPKGECFFSVEVVPDDGSFRVTTFGPLALQSGQLPEWLK